MDLNGTLVLPILASTPDEYKPIPGAAYAIALCGRAGFASPVVTVQSRIEKGLSSEPDFRRWFGTRRAPWRDTPRTWTGRLCPHRHRTPCTCRSRSPSSTCAPRRRSRSTVDVEVEQLADHVAPAILGAAHWIVRHGRAMLAPLEPDTHTMLTLSDLAGPDSYQRAPRIPASELRLLWYVDFWDGPRSGMLQYHDEECWFQIVAENQDDRADWYRRFVVLRLTPEQHAQERRWHELFRTNVGIHTDYEPTEQRPSKGWLWPRERWKEFYEPYARRAAPDFSANQVLGWFER